MTNEPMGSQLIPLLEYRDKVKNLAESEFVDEVTKIKFQIRINLLNMGKLCDEGDSSTMLFLGCNHQVLGNHGLSHHWFEKLANLNDVDGLFNTGLNLLRERGVEKDEIRGMSLLICAAERSHSLACCFLLWCNSSGMMQVDQNQVKVWRSNCSSFIDQQSPITIEMLMKWYGDYLLEKATV